MITTDTTYHTSAAALKGMAMMVMCMCMMMATCRSGVTV